MNAQERAAMQQALEALEAGPDVCPIFAGETEAALRAALAQEQVEPSGYCTLEQLVVMQRTVPSPDKIAIYTTPPQRPPLTDAEMLDIIDDAMEGGSLLDVVRAIERKVRGE